MAMKILEDAKRAAIIECLARNELKFNDLLRKLNMKSNELSYHLNILVDGEFLKKNSDEHYVLTDNGKVVVPYLKMIQKEELPPTVFCAPVVVRNGKVLFIRREKEPYKGFLEFPGGKVRKGETMIDAAIRELLEETNIIADHGRIICIADILTSKNHHFIGVYVQLDFVKDLGIEGAEHDEILWIDKKRISSAEKMLDDNKLVVSKFLDKSLQHITLFYNEDNNIAKLK